MNDLKFNSKLVVITGVTQGLGEAMLGEFYARGFTVVGCARNSMKLAELSTKYLNGEFYIVNVSSHAEVQRWVNNLVVKFGVPKFIINNASIIDEPKQPFELADINNLTNVIQVNLFGAMYVVHALLPFVKLKDTSPNRSSVI